MIVTDNAFALFWLAPRRDDVKDWYTVNWVGNVDRHQSQVIIPPLDPKR